MTDSRRKHRSGQTYQTPIPTPSNPFTPRKPGNRSDSVFQSAIPSVSQQDYWTHINQSANTHFAYSQPFVDPLDPLPSISCVSARESSEIATYYCNLLQYFGTKTGAETKG